VKRFATAQLAIIPPEKTDFHRAAELCDQWQTGLRAGDALHVAIAERHGLTVCTLDQIMFDAAKTLGLVAKSV
jgi:predicted nucleic acid-binding protein